MLLFGDFSLWSLLAIGIVLFFGMGWHEYAHAVVADYWGDPTPRSMGRLTPNPLVHIFWPGWLMFLVLGFGILGSVPVSPHRMRDPRWGNFWTSAAGPLSNLLMALVCAILLRLTGGVLVGISMLYGGLEPGAVNGFLPDFIALLLTAGVFFNILLFVFNLLPFFPIDGWRMVLAMLPGQFLTSKQVPQVIRDVMPPLARFLQEPAYKWQQWAQVSQYVLFGLIFLSFALPQLNILGVLIAQPTTKLLQLMLGF